MNIHQPPSALTKKPLVSGDRGTLMQTLVNLWPFIWPSDRSDLKLRVIIATLLLFLAKVATMAVPFTFKWVTDALASGQAFASGASWGMIALSVPIVRTLAYGAMRILMALITQGRDGMFAKVA